MDSVVLSTLPVEIWLQILSYVFPSAAVKTVCKDWCDCHRYLVRTVKAFIDRPNFRFVPYPHLEHLTIRGDIAPAQWPDLEHVTTLRSLRFAESDIRVAPEERCRPHIPRSEGERRMDMNRRLVTWAATCPRLERLTIEKVFPVSLASLTQLRRLEVFILKLDQILTLTQLRVLTLRVRMKRPERLDLRPLARLEQLRIANTPFEPLRISPSVTRLSVDTLSVGRSPAESAEVLKHIRCLDIPGERLELHLVQNLTGLEELILRGNKVSRNVLTVVPGRLKVQFRPRRKRSFS